MALHQNETVLQMGEYMTLPSLHPAPTELIWQRFPKECARHSQVLISRKGQLFHKSWTLWFSHCSIPGTDCDMRHQERQNDDQSEITTPSITCQLFGWNWYGIMTDSLIWHTTYSSSKNSKTQVNSRKSVINRNIHPLGKGPHTRISITQLTNRKV